MFFFFFFLFIHTRMRPIEIMAAYLLPSFPVRSPRAAARCKLPFALRPGLSHLTMHVLVVVVAAHIAKENVVFLVYPFSAVVQSPCSGRRDRRQARRTEADRRTGGQPVWC